MPPPAVADKSDLFAQYQIVEELGEHPNYTLYKVKSPTGSFKLWKKVDTQFNTAAAAVETRLLPVLEKIHHPYLNAVTNSFVFPDKGLLFVESDYPAKTLADRLEECKGHGSQTGVPVSELFAYIAQVAEGLDFLNAPQHQHQNRKIAIYHRAVSPDSMQLFEEKNKIVCKLGDFGLAKPVMETGQAVRHSLGLTNYDYAPPEFDEGVVANTSDQYSLATTYYVLRTGKFPFTGSLLAKLQAQLSGAADLAAVDAAERPAIARALSKDPVARFRSCREFVQHLQSALGGMAAGGPVNVQKILGKQSSESGRRGGVLSGASSGGSLAKSTSRSGAPAVQAETPGPTAKTPLAGAGWSFGGGVSAAGNAKAPASLDKKGATSSFSSPSAAPPIGTSTPVGAAAPNRVEAKVELAPTTQPKQAKSEVKPVTLETENWTPGSVTSARTTRVEVPSEPPTPPPPTPAPKSEALSSKARETLELLKKRQAQLASQGEKASGNITKLTSATQTDFQGTSAAQLANSAPTATAASNRTLSPPPRMEYPAPGLPAGIKRSIRAKADSSKNSKTSKNSKKSTSHASVPDLQTQPQPSGPEPMRVSFMTLVMVMVAAFCVGLLFIVLFSKFGR
jgi:serine/threonine-protein kinase